MRKTKTIRPPAACQIPLVVVVAETRAQRRTRLWRELEAMHGRPAWCGRHDALPLCQWGPA